LDYRVASSVLGVLRLGLLVWAFRLRKANIVLQAEIDELGKQLQEAVHRLALRILVASHWRFGNRASARLIKTETASENAEARSESVRRVALFVPLSICRI
jgi:hypothetical protein